MSSCLLPQLPLETAPGKPARQPGPLTDLHLEIVEGVLIDVLHLLHEPHGVVRKGRDVGAARLIIGAGVQARGSHVGATNRLDLLQLPEPLLTDDLDNTEGPSCQGKEAQPWPSAHSLPCLGPLPHRSVASAPLLLVREPCFQLLLSVQD